MEELLAQARSGDGEAFAALVRPFQPELRTHCYRILGSVQDAEDALQETLMAAWRGLPEFEGRSSLRAWLYRIATNKSLNALRGGRQRPGAGRTAAEREASGPTRELPAPTRIGEPLWVQPYPDSLLGELPDVAPGPEALYEARESISLAFVAAVQRLPATQRAALVLRDVLGFRAAEAAEILDITVDAVNGLLRRARAGIARDFPAGPAREPAQRPPLPASAQEREIVARFTDAYDRGDVPAIVALLTADATLTMPPLPLVYQGRDAVGAFLTFICQADRFRLIPTRANGHPAFGCYVRDPAAPVAHAHGLLVLALSGDRISEITRFLDNSVLPVFGLPRSIPD